MNVRDRLWLPERADKLVAGHLTLELRDGDTGRLQERVEADNYATDMLIAELKWAARLVLASRVGWNSPTSNSTYGPEVAAGPATSGPSVSAGVNLDYAPVNAGPNGVVLTDAHNPEDPSGDRQLRGRIIGWSDLLPFTGADTQRGQQNPTEGTADATKTRFVFDWPTTAGNGTIRSVYWASLAYYGGTSASIDKAINLVYPVDAANHGYGSLWSESYAGVTSSGWGNVGFVLDPDGVSYWRADYSGRLIKRTLGTGAVVTVLDISAGITQIIGLAFDGTNFWVLNNSGVLRKYNTSGVYQSVQYTSASGWSGSTCNGLAFGNGHLWVLDNLKVYEVDPATGTVIQSWSHGLSFSYSSSNRGGIAYLPDDGYNGAEIWLSPTFALTSLGDFCNAFDASGTFRRKFGSPIGLNSNSGWSVIPDPVSGGFYAASESTSGSSQVFAMTAGRQFFARSLLPADVVKANTQTMKLTYEFDYS